MSSLTDLEPRSLWTHFDGLTRCPRPSGKEERAIEFVRAVAEKNGWPLRTDARGNVFISIPATENRENAPVVMLQSHLDMVGEKNADVDHDFDVDPIQTVIDGEWVHAKGTTLGADNGIGVAAALAAGDASERPHGPLQLVFTLDEETGLTGAAALDGSYLEGNLLLNLDSEEDGALYVGCAGGADAHFSLPIAHRAAPAGYVWRELVIRGLKGGHSGMNIIENRGNAIVLMARWLRSAGADFKPLIADFAGGGKHNAIPREARALVGIPKDSIKDWEAFSEKLQQVFAAELPPLEDSFAMEQGAIDSPTEVLVNDDCTTLLRLLVSLPHGVLAMSSDVPGLVETSNNLAVVSLSEETAKIITSARSSIDSKKLALLDAQHALAELCGAQVELHDGYPGWKPNMDSTALAAAREAYREIWGSEPHVAAIHAGLECGLLGERKPGLDMVSFGPCIEGAHSPDERVNVPSVGRFWDALGRVLEKLSD
jgi:dipeptidase D